MVNFQGCFSKLAFVQFFFYVFSIAFIMHAWLNMVRHATDGSHLSLYMHWWALSTKQGFNSYSQQTHDVMFELLSVRVAMCIKTCVCVFCYTHWDTNVSTTEIVCRRGICPRVEKLSWVALSCCCCYCFHAKILFVHTCTIHAGSTTTTLKLEWLCTCLFVSPFK